MQVVQDVLIQKLLNYLDEIIHAGKIKLNGEYVTYTIFKTKIEGNMIRKYLYMETEMGYIEEAQLVTSMGEVLAIKPFSIEKLEDGLVLAFEFKITVVEG